MECGLILLTKGVRWENFIHEGRRQVTEYSSVRKMGPAVWILKVGEKVRVNKPGRIANGKVGVIVDGDAGEYEVRIEHENLRSCELKAEHLELIEAAS